MDASKLSVSPDYLRFQKLGRNKKAMLRRKNVIELIRSKPAGTPITLSEFQVICAYTSTTAAYELIKDMLKRGTIVRHIEGFNRHSYSVAADAITKPRDKASAAAPPVAETPAPSDLLSLAKEFTWSQNSDSLRDFIAWVGKRNEKKEDV